jgi:hypothetical protein
MDRQSVDNERLSPPNSNELGAGNLDSDNNGSAVVDSSPPSGTNDDLLELNQRQSVVRDRVRGVAHGHSTGFYLFGRPGTAKTHTVLRALDACGREFKYISGHITAMGLYELLAKHNSGVLVLDDLPAIFRGNVAPGLLLSALGTQSGSKHRVISYRRKGHAEDVIFSGGIIIISNIQLHDTPVFAAIKSRVHCLNYDPTDAQIAALMREIASRGWPADKPKLSPEECSQVAEYLIGQSQKLGLRLDIRLLVSKALPDFFQFRERDAETNWMDLIQTTLLEKLCELRHTAKDSRGRVEVKEDERRLIRKLRGEFASQEERISAWVERTHKSARAYYRRAKEIGDG